MTDDDRPAAAPEPHPSPAPHPTPEPHPTGHVAAHAAPATGTSRRWFLAGGAALVVGAGVGVAGGFVHDPDADSHEPVRPPRVLVAAAAAERALIADLDATAGGSTAVRTVLGQVRADHAAHLRALAGLLAAYPSPKPSSQASISTSATTSTPTVSTPSGTPRTAAQLRVAEAGAAAASARRADATDGTLAALLASIAACEATHAELLT